MDCARHSSESAVARGLEHYAPKKGEIGHEPGCVCAVIQHELHADWCMLDGHHVDCPCHKRRAVPWQQKRWVVPMEDGYQAELSIDCEFDITCFFRKPETTDEATGVTIPEQHVAALAFRRGEACSLGLALLEATKEAGAAWAARDLRTNPDYKPKDEP